VVDPERHPRQHDDQQRREVVLEQEETDVAFQLEAQRQPLITTYTAVPRTSRPVSELLAERGLTLGPCKSSVYFCNINKY